MADSQVVDAGVRGIYAYRNVILDLRRSRLGPAMAAWHCGRRAQIDGRREALLSASR